MVAVGMWESRCFLRDFQGRWKEWEAWVWLSMLSTDRHFHGNQMVMVVLPAFFWRSKVRRKRYDSVPVSRMWARSVMRSSSGEHRVRISRKPRKQNASGSYRDRRFREHGLPP